MDRRYSSGAQVRAPACHTDPVRSLVTAVAHDLDVEVRESSRLRGGDVAESYRMELGDDRTVFAKTHRNPPSGFFTTEASGLQWLHEAGTVPVPAVLAVSDGDDGFPPRLVLEWIDEAPRRSPDDDSDFGRGLAQLHRSGAPSFGRVDRRTTGSLALPNDPCSTWVEFFGERRLAVLLRIAHERAALPDRVLAKLQRTIDRLDSIGGVVEPPARLHGDLWARNRLIDRSGRSWLIDPACHGGHREYDLAMMRLFGGFGPQCFAAYDAEWPLAAGWEARVPLHQLAPLVVHAIKFGGSYAAATEQALDAVWAI
jgi:fructosamine-3-kinase